MLKKLSYLIVVAALIVMAGTINVRAASTLHWTGQTNTVWQNPPNWDLGQVPGQDDDVFLDPLSTSPNPAPTFSSASTTGTVHSGFFFGLGANAPRCGTLNMTGGTVNVASALRSTKNAGTAAMNPVMNMSGGTMNITGIHTVSGAWISVNHGSFSWGESTNGGTATWNMTAPGATVLCGSLSLPAANTNNHAVINLNAGTFNIREDSYGYGTTEGRGLFIGEDGTRSTAGPYDGKLNIAGGTLLCGSNLMTPAGGAPGVTGDLISRYVTAGRIVAYPLDTTKRRYIVWDYDSRNTGKTTVTAVKQEMNQAWKPTPFDGDRFAPVAPTLSWSKGNNGVDANSQLVYFGTTFADVNTATTATPTIYKGSQTTITYLPGTLEYGKTYYWRIDEFYNTGSVTVKGLVWSFAITGRAKDPSPGIGDANEPPYSGEVTLRWTAGTGATSHAIYLGTNSASLPLLASQTGTSKLLTGANKPTMGATYYWRIDETGSYTGTITGDVWNFKVNAFRTVEDFESYLNTSALRAKWLAFNTLATFDLATGTVPHHGGAKGMQINYSIGGNDYEEAQKDFGSAQDWTFNNTGAKALTLYIRGAVSNKSLASLGVVLTDGDGDSSATVNYPTPDTIVKGEDWVEWNIDLSSFAATNFDIDNVQQIAIHIETTSTAASNNVLYVDDIRLYPSRCVDTTTDIGKADITNDCVVNLDDLDYIVEDWLKADSQAIPNGTLTNFNFDSTDGWVTGKFGNGLKFDGVNDWVDIDDAALPTFYNRTIAFWLKRNGTPAAGQIWSVLGTSNTWRVNINITTANALDVRIGSATSTITSSAIGTSFTHVALTLSRNPANDQVTGELFINGASVGTVDSPAPAHYYTYLNGIGIGALNNGTSQYAQITIDDFRIYDSVLNLTQIGTLADSTLGNEPASPLILYAFEDSSTSATQGGSIGNIYHPINYRYNDVLGDTRANLYTSESAPLTIGQKINMKDYAKLSKYWLQTIAVWP